MSKKLTPARGEKKRNKERKGHVVKLKQHVKLNMMEGHPTWEHFVFDVDSKCETDTFFVSLVHSNNFLNGLFFGIDFYFILFIANLSQLR